MASYRTYTRQDRRPMNGRPTLSIRTDQEVTGAPTAHFSHTGYSNWNPPPAYIPTQAPQLLESEAAPSQPNRPNRPNRSSRPRRRSPSPGDEAQPIASPTRQSQSLSQYSNLPTIEEAEDLLHESTGRRPFLNPAQPMYFDGFEWLSGNESLGCHSLSSAIFEGSEESESIASDDIGRLYEDHTDDDMSTSSDDSIVEPDPAIKAEVDRRLTFEFGQFVLTITSEESARLRLLATELAVVTERIIKAERILVASTGLATNVTPWQEMVALREERGDLMRQKDDLRIVMCERMT